MPKYTISYDNDDQQKIFLASASSITVGEDSSATVTIKGSEYLVPINSGSDVTPTQKAPTTGQAVFEFFEIKAGEMGIGKLSRNDIVIEDDNYTYDTLPDTLEGSIIEHPAISTTVVKCVMGRMYEDINLRLEDIEERISGLAPTINTKAGLTLDSSGSICVKTGPGTTFNTTGSLCVDIDDNTIKIIDNKLTVSQAGPNNPGIVTITDSLEDTSPNSVLSSEAVKNIFYQAVPVGTILIYAGNESEAPEGYMYCRGQSVSTGLVSAEFKKVVSGLYGNPTNITNTVILPNLKGMFVRGWDNTSSYDVYQLYNGGTVRREPRSFGSTQLPASPQISGWWRGRQEADNYCGGCIYPSNVTSEFEGLGGGGNMNRVTFNFYASNSHWVYASGMGEVRPYNVAMNYIIKVR